MLQATHHTSDALVVTWESVASWAFRLTCSGVRAPTMTAWTGRCCRHHDRQALGMLTPAVSHADAMALMAWRTQAMTWLVYSGCIMYSCM